MALDASRNSPTTTLDSSIKTQHCGQNIPPSIIHTMHHCRPFSFHTSTNTATHTAQTQSLTTSYLSAYTINQIWTLTQRHSIHNLLHGFLIMQHVLAYWIGCLFEHMPYSTVHLSMNTSSLITECLSQDRIDKLTPGYHSIIKHAHDYTP